MRLTIKSLLRGASKQFRGSRTISDRLSEVARNPFIGRQNELAFLSDAIEIADPPFILAFLQGPGGIGKSRLLLVMFKGVRPEIRYYVLDRREIEPTPQGFHTGLGAAREMAAAAIRTQPDLEITESPPPLWSMKRWNRTITTERDVEADTTNMSPLPQSLSYVITAGESRKEGNVL